LINFLGFQEDNGPDEIRESNIQLEQKEALYAEHLEMSELILGIK
jgi:hypothetical protein